jgi:hypothetical protein
MSIDLRPVLDLVTVQGSEHIDWLARMRANERKHAPEAIRLQESRLPLMRLNYGIVEAVLALPDVQKAVQEYMSQRGYADDA